MSFPWELLNTRSSSLFCSSYCNRTSDPFHWLLRPRLSKTSWLLAAPARTIEGSFWLFRPELRELLTKVFPLSSTVAGCQKNNCTAFRHNGREIYKARKEGAYAFMAVDEKVRGKEHHSAQQRKESRQCAALDCEAL